jgi:hypothetical protein
MREVHAGEADEALRVGRGPAADRAAVTSMLGALDSRLAARRTQ